jgi:hypothetical protein
MKMGYWRWVELNKFMCGIDGRVMKEVSKREQRDAYGFGGCGPGVSSPAIEVTGGDGVTAATSAVTAVLAKLKVLWRSLSMSQVGWEEGEGSALTLAFCFSLLSSFRCTAWYSFSRSGA